jgi:hypothetical protein
MSNISFVDFNERILMRTIKKISNKFKEQNIFLFDFYTKSIYKLIIK